jgi:hypothetical protein
MLTVTGSFGGGVGGTVSTITFKFTFLSASVGKILVRMVAALSFLKALVLAVMVGVVDMLTTVTGAWVSFAAVGTSTCRMGWIFVVLWILLSSVLLLLVVALSCLGMTACPVGKEVFSAVGVLILLMVLLVLAVYIILLCTPIVDEFSIRRKLSLRVSVSAAEEALSNLDAVAVLVLVLVLVLVALRFDKGS